MEIYVASMFGILLAGVGFYTCFTQLRNFRLLSAWKTIRAKVSERGAVVANTPSVRNSGRRFRPFLRYHYRIDGQDFSNDSIFPMHMLEVAGSSDWAKKFVEVFDSEITIFYNSENPSDSFVRMPSKMPFYIIGFASALIFLYAVFVLIFGVDHWVGAFN